MDEWNKCYFCKCYDEYEGCEYGCDNGDGYTPNQEKLIKKSKEKNISIADVISLIGISNK